MADAADSKSAVGDHVGVQVPLSAPSLYCILLSSLALDVYFTTSTACLSPLREGLQDRDKFFERSARTFAKRSVPELVISPLA